jgi:hypothetical protein
MTSPAWLRQTLLSPNLPLLQGKTFMKIPNSPVSPSVHQGKPLPVSLFKTSLRDWQAGYQARRVVGAPNANKVRVDTSPA